jgi:hypothetical protein
VKVELVNPLPAALSHYQAEIVSTLRLAGHDVTVSPLSIDIEVGAASRSSKIRRGLLSLIRGLRYRSQADRVLVLWPVFGYWDGLIFRNAASGRRTSVIMHDPISLRPTFGYSVFSRFFARWACRFGVSAEWIVHGQLAATALLSEGIHASQVLPHPILSGQKERADRTKARCVTVLGQFKASRDLEMLARLGSHDASKFEFRILGRGWPPVAGWHLTDRFISEAEFDEATLESVAVVIPYSSFFQSGVAVRCLETLTPVLGPDHEFLRELFGDDYVGLISSEANPCLQLEALTRVSPNRSTVLRERYIAIVSEAWRVAWNVSPDAN